MRVPRPSRIESMYGTPQHRSPGGGLRRRVGMCPLEAEPRRFKLARTPIRVPFRTGAPLLNNIQRDKSNDGSDAHKKVSKIDPDLLDDSCEGDSMREDASLAWRTINEI